MLVANTGEHQPERPVDAWARQREDGAWEIEGAMPVAELKSRLEIDAFPDEDRGRYATVAGLMHAMAGTLLQRGEHVDGAGWRFEVLELDGRRIDRVLVAATKIDHVTTGQYLTGFIIKHQGLEIYQLPLLIKAITLNIFQYHRRRAGGKTG